MKEAQGTMERSILIVDAGVNMTLIRTVNQLRYRLITGGTPTTEPHVLRQRSANMVLRCVVVV